MWNTAVLIVILSTFVHSFEIVHSNFNEFHELQRFWTNTGFCPNGNYKLSKSLLSNDVRIHLNLIGALPQKAISTVRIHWLLYLIRFVRYQRNNIPEYNFDNLDIFLNWIHEAGLTPGFEFMGDIFNLSKNISKSYLWEDLSYQIGERYLETFGEDEIVKWKFESWNEPDLKQYNIMNFTVDEYLEYLTSLRRGLNAVSRRISDNHHIKLYGPAGLFKSRDHHQLCWSALESCQSDLKQCPFDILTFHRKGQGHAKQVLQGERYLLEEIFNNYPALQEFPISNDEADPISVWSTPRKFQSDIRYAATLILIILKHWSAKLNSKYFKNLHSISHDNAFLSYHPYEFEQRTLFARFQMNESNPVYSQFIGKPVYSSLGMLSNLGKFAKDVETTRIRNQNLTLLTTRGHHDAPFYLATVVVSPYQLRTIELSLKISTPPPGDNEIFAFCLEALETNRTDPVQIWNSYGRPAYPNTTIRELMRRAQTPKILAMATLNESLVQLNYELNSPWIAVLRVCSSKILPPLQPKNLRLMKITHGEVLVLWNEISRPERCIKTYEVEFSFNDGHKTTNFEVWQNISEGWSLPFLSFNFQPENQQIEGYYRVRAVDIFGRYGNFSNSVFFKDEF